DRRVAAPTGRVARVDGAGIVVVAVDRAGQGGGGRRGGRGGRRRAGRRRAAARRRGRRTELVDAESSGTTADLGGITSTWEVALIRRTHVWSALRAVAFSAELYAEVLVTGAERLAHLDRHRIGRFCCP